MVLLNKEIEINKGLSEIGINEDKMKNKDYWFYDIDEVNEWFDEPSKFEEINSPTCSDIRWVMDTRSIRYRRQQKLIALFDRFFDKLIKLKNEK